MARKLLLVLLLLAPLGFYPILRNRGEDPKPPEPPPTPYKLSKQNELAMYCLASLPGPFPANLPWEALRRIGVDETQQLRELAEKEPIKFLERCLAEYEKNVQSYRTTFLKQERVKGKLRKPEELTVNFREKPFSVHMLWLKGMDLAKRSMYVEGENGGKLLALPTLEFLGIWTKAVDDPAAMATSRFPITQFGMKIGAMNTLRSIRAAEARKQLHLRFEGIETVAKLGDRPCYKFNRFKYDPPEEDNVGSMTFYIDQELLMQTGSTLYDTNGELVAEYFFRDIELNPTFPADEFTKKAMK